MCIFVGGGRKKRVAGCAHIQRERIRDLTGYFSYDFSEEKKVPVILSALVHAPCVYCIIKVPIQTFNVYRSHPETVSTLQGPYTCIRACTDGCSCWMGVSTHTAVCSCIWQMIKLRNRNRSSVNEMLRKPYNRYMDVQGNIF